MKITVGQLLVNEALPPELRDYTRVLDKKNVAALMQEVAEKYPDKYTEINQALYNFGKDTVTNYGGVTSLSLDAFKTPEGVRKLYTGMNVEIQKILADKIPQSEKNAKIVELIGKQLNNVTETNYQESLAANNPMALQVLSGSRGNKMQFRATTAGDMLLVDHKDRPIPIPVLTSYAEGVDPVQYWAGAYGARKGAISTKFATPKSGFLGKQMALASHRLIVTEKDCGAATGIPIDGGESDNEGALLAQTAGNFPAGTVLTPKVIKQLAGQKVLIRSPITCQASKGVCQRCAGIRERGSFPPLGDNIGIAAAQAVSEPLGQAALGEKHGGGQAKAGVTSGPQAKKGLDLINQIVQVPKTFQGGATGATVDGTVDQITPAPQGGSYVHIGGAEHWVPLGAELKVKTGDRVEAGDMLCSGIPNPAEIVHHKGIGEGRRYFTELFHKILADSGVKAHRRNVEVLARGLINHVTVTEVDAAHNVLPDDTVEFDHLVRDYKPRYGFKSIAPKQAVGLYLEQPVLHFSIGTRVTPKVAAQLAEHKVDNVLAHDDPPGFVPEMTRAMDTLTSSDDWMVRLGGFHLKKGLTESVHRNRSSNVHGTSYIPSLAYGVEFGKVEPGKGY